MEQTEGWTPGIPPPHLDSTEYLSQNRDIQVSAMLLPINCLSINWELDQQFGQAELDEVQISFRKFHAATEVRNF